MSPSDRARERRLLNELSRINNDYGTQQRRAMQELARSRRELATAQGVLGMVAHDLRTPLQAVLGFAEFLLEEDLDPHQRDLAERISRAGAQMSELADELLETFSETAPELRLVPVDVVALVDEVTTRHRLLGPARVVEVRQEIAVPHGARPQVLGDQARLQRVLDNLVGNAIKFSPTGGTVTIALTVEGDQVAIAVSDEGPGIDAAEQEAVFTPFHRTAAAAGVPGIGLGLTIVRQLVERHGGSIRLHSEPGHGATFTVRLPVLPD
jgi:signal transduction histidine kinase